MSGRSAEGATGRRRSNRYNRIHVIGAFLLGCCFASTVTIFFNFTALSTLDDQSSEAVSIHQKAAGSELIPVRGQEEPRSQLSKSTTAIQKLAANHNNIVHPVAGLDCSHHDGPNLAEDAQEMAYWRDIQADNSWTSPFKKTTRQYLSFEPDGGGWNNIRMSMETVLTMAIAMGRVLVLPPSQKMYLLGQTTFNFADFFPLQEMAEEHPGLEIISMEQFLEETMGKTRDTKTQEILYPPGRKTKWDGDTQGIKKELGPWLRSVALNPIWNPTKCIAAFPKSADQQDVDELQQMMEEILAEENGKFASNKAYKAFINKPTPVDGSTKDRLREFLSERSSLCIYDKTYQEASIIHFHGKSGVEGGGGRLLVHFYAFLFFQDWHTDLWMKRFVRDHVRYIDNIQCVAARIVHKLRTEYKEPTFDSFHIRRNEFQYKQTRVDADVIVAQAKDQIPAGRTVYVGTDEKNKQFFRPFKDEAGWNVLFLDDFKDIIGDNINPNYYGMIDQLVVSRGETFFGCWFSTFTGYIMRLRGYHSQLHLDDGNQNPNTQAYREGRLPNSFYYALKDSKTKMHDYWPVKPVFYAREFPVSWRNLDADVTIGT
mmetsp:Transcript_14561/g.40453  ORF Transcript_14561/g.40453 Transcript_14561/m.40453 type:complete len:598 (+) Transcript_14561:130-1923(+)